MANNATLLIAALVVAMTGPAAAFHPVRSMDADRCRSRANASRLSSGATPAPLRADGHGDDGGQRDPDAADAWQSRAATDRASSSLRRRRAASGGVLYRQAVLSAAERRSLDAGLASLLRRPLADEAPSSIAFRRSVPRRRRRRGTPSLMF